MSLKTLGKINRLDRKSEQTFKFHGIELIENAERSEWLKKKPRYDKLHAYRNANQQWNGEEGCYRDQYYLLATRWCDATLLHQLLRYRTADRTFPETRLIQLRSK